MNSQLNLIRSLWLVAVIALPRLALAVSASGIPALANAYDAHGQPTMAYDAASASVIGYDGAREHAADETRNGTTRHCVLFAEFGRLVAAKVTVQFRNFRNEVSQAMNYNKARGKMSPVFLQST